MSKTRKDSWEESFKEVRRIYSNAKKSDVIYAIYEFGDASAIAKLIHVESHVFSLNQLKILLNFFITLFFKDYTMVLRQKRSLLVCKLSRDFF